LWYIFGIFVLCLWYICGVFVVYLWLSTSTTIYTDLKYLAGHNDSYRTSYITPRNVSLRVIGSQYYSDPYCAPPPRIS
jgi:hypothetical protein